MNIEIISVSKTTRSGSKPGSSFGQLDVAYKNLDKGGKVEGKKVMSFGDWSKAYGVLENAQQGEQFTVKNEKKGDYWVWTEVSKGAASAPANNNYANKNATPAPKSTYETPEERARRQVLIVRQSSLSAAIDTLKTDKTSPKPEEVLELAERYVQFVFQEEAKQVEPVAPDFEDDIPF